MNKECFESFLYDVVRVDVYESATCPIPFCVQHIHSMSVTLPLTPLLTLDYNETDEIAVVDGSITAKNTSSRNGNRTYYSYEINANIDTEGSKMAEKLDNVFGKDCIMVLRTMNGTSFMIYTLPNTFRLDKTKALGGNVTLKLSAKALSDFINIDLA